MSYFLDSSNTVELIDAGFYDVTRLGVLGNGANDSYAFQRIITEIGNKPAIIWAPPQDQPYLVSDVSLNSNTQIVGAGKSSTVFKRAITGPDGSASSGVVFKATSESNVGIKDVGIDCNSHANFDTCISLVQCDWCVVKDCYLYDSSSDRIGSDTLHAVLIGTSTNCKVLDCRTFKTQIKVGGSSIFVKNNQIYNPHNLGISSVIFDDVESFDGIFICDNIIFNPGGTGGIYTGNDHNDGGFGSFRNLHVCRNQVIGDTWSAFTPVGITFRACRVSDGWNISDNIVINEGSTATNSIGMLCGNVPGTALSNCTVNNNIVKNFDQVGISVASNMTDVSISNNIVSGTRGIAVYGAGSSGKSNVSVSNNRCKGIGVQGIYVSAYSQNLDIDVNNNVVVEPTGGTSKGITIDAQAGKTLIARVRGNSSTADIAYQSTGGGTVTSYFNGNVQNGVTAYP